MLSEGFSDPAILALAGAEDDNEVVAGSIVGVKEVCDYFEKTETARKDDEFVFIAELGEEGLLEFLAVMSV